MDAEVGAKPTGMGRAAYPDSPTAPLPEPPERDVLAALARQVDESPNQPAVDDGAVVLSYRDLWARAGRLAEHLAAAGVASEDRVVIVGPRSAAWVVGFLGALRAGAVAVPVSTVFPPQRCAKMALESGAGHAIVVGDEPDWAGSLRTISIRADATPRITDLPRASPAPQGEHATIYFTSGSTGPPKAVLGTHVGLASASAAWSRTTFALSTTDRISLVTNIGFVGILRSVFGTLTSGATLCIAPGDDRDHGSHVARGTRSRHSPADVALDVLRRRAASRHVGPGMARSDSGERSCRELLGRDRDGRRASVVRGSRSSTSGHPAIAAPVDRHPVADLRRGRRRPV